MSEPVTTIDLVEPPEATGSRFLSRKFLLTTVAFATFTGLRVAGLLDQASFQVLAMFVLGGYLTANVTQKATAK